MIIYHPGSRLDLEAGDHRPRPGIDHFCLDPIFTQTHLEQFRHILQLLWRVVGLVRLRWCQQPHARNLAIRLWQVIQARALALQVLYRPQGRTTGFCSFPRLFSSCHTA